ncbi:MAG: hypothetical protein RL677_831 [Actinomycetota bacterium]|jgi:hypothetical protein
MNEKTKNKVSAVIAFILICLIPLGLYSNWIQTNFKNQDNFVNAFSLQAENAKIKELLLDSTYEYIDNLEIKKIIEENFPEALAPLSAEIELSAKRALKILSQDLINSNTFEVLWNELLTEIHQEFTKVIIEDSQGYFRVYANELYATSAPIKERLILNLSRDPAWRNFIEVLNTLEPPKIRVLDAEQLGFVKVSWQVSSLVTQYLWLVLIVFAMLLVSLQKSVLTSFMYLGLSMLIGGSFTILSNYLLANFINNRLTNNLAEEMLVIFFNTSSRDLQFNSVLTILVGLVVLFIYLINYLKTKSRAVNN